MRHLLQDPCYNAFPSSLLVWGLYCTAPFPAGPWLANACAFGSGGGDVCSTVLDQPGQAPLAVYILEWAPWAAHVPGTTCRAGPACATWGQLRPRGNTLNQAMGLCGLDPACRPYLWYSFSRECGSVGPLKDDTQHLFPSSSVISYWQDPIEVYGKNALLYNQQLNSPLPHKYVWRM